jgi:hypothetical protein
LIAWQQAGLVIHYTCRATVQVGANQQEGEEAGPGTRQCQVCGASSMDSYCKQADSTSLII